MNKSFKKTNIFIEDTAITSDNKHKPGKSKARSTSATNKAMQSTLKDNNPNDYWNLLNKCLRDGGDYRVQSNTIYQHKNGGNISGSWILLNINNESQAKKL